MSVENSKLGFHLQKRRHGWPLVVADTTPALVKSLEWGIIDEWISAEQSEPGKMELARQWQQRRTFLLGRWVARNQRLDHPAERAADYWEALLDSLTGTDLSKRAQVVGRMRLFDAWEGYNEIGTGPDAGDLARFDAALAKIVHGYGMRYAGGGFAMTHPVEDDWHLYCAAMQEEIALGRGDLPDFLHFHEYWFPDENWPDLMDQAGEIDPALMREATRGYMLHWRDLYALRGTPPELRRPVIISECGWDQGQPQQVGYRASRRSDADYLRWLIWYDQELQKPLDGIDYVVGAAIFTYGHEARWESFEVDQMHGRGVLEPLRSYLRQANQHPHPQSWQSLWDTSPGESDDEPSGEQTHYVLLGPKCSASWRHALTDYLGAFQATSGQSVEDALRLAGKEHHITMVGSAGALYGVPQAWEREIRYRQPDAKLDRMQALSDRELRRVVARRVGRNDRFGDQDDAPLPPRPRLFWRRSSQ